MLQYLASNIGHKGHAAVDKATWQVKNNNSKNYRPTVPRIQQKYLKNEIYPIIRQVEFKTTTNNRHYCQVTTSSITEILQIQHF